jgi:hypothetical protein
MTEPITTAPTPAVDNATPAPVAAQTPEGILDSATPAATPEPVGYWDGASDDVKNHAGFEGLKGKIDSQDGLTLAYLNLQAHLGSRDEGGVKLPTAESTPEELAEYREKTGVPVAAGDYKWEGMPEGMELDTEILTERNAKMHEMNITQAQYTELMSMHNEEVNSIHTMAQEFQAETMATTKEALTAEWGADYGKNIDAVAKVAERFGVKDALMESGVINSKPVMDMLFAVHLSTTSDGIVKTPDQGYNRSDEKKAVQAQLSSLPYAHKDREGLMKKLVALS